MAQGRAFLDDELQEVERVGDAGEVVQRGGDVEVGREAMIDDGEAAVGREGGDLDPFGEAAAAGEVDLDDVDPADVHELEERLALALLLARGNPQRAGGGELGVAEIVVGE